MSKNKYNVDIHSDDLYYMGRKYKSKLEAHVACTLDGSGLLGLWNYEYMLFELRGKFGAVYRYRPDFFIVAENEHLDRIVDDSKQPAFPEYPGIKYIVEAKGALTKKSKGTLLAYELRRLEMKLPPLIIASNPDIFSWELAKDYLERVK